jgi:putative peptidoglycan lipid II flippase
MSTAKSISIASLIMMGSVLLSRVMGVVREIVLAGFGGTTSQMDAYVAAFLIPEFLNHLLAGGFMSITFIPLFQRYLLDNDEDRASRMFSNIFTVGSFAMLVLIAVCMVFTKELLGLLGSQINDPVNLVLATRMTRIILPAQLFFYWGALFMAVQFANKKFFVPALAPLFYNGGIILSGLVLGRSMGIEGFAWGVLAGAFVGNVAIQMIGMANTRLKYRFVIDLRDRDLITYVLISLPLVLGLGMQFSNEVLFRIFGSHLGEGDLASLNYSLRVMWVLVGIFGQAVGIASYPFLTSLAAQGKLNDLNRTAYGIMRKISVLLIPISAIVMVLSPEVVTVLFQRGQFTAASTISTAPVLTIYLIGAFAFGATTIVTRCFYALQNTLLPMMVSSIVVVMTIPLYWFLASSLAGRGIALAGSITAILLFLVMVILWTKRHGSVLMAKELAITCLKATFAAVVAGGTVFLIRNALWSVSLISAARPFVSNLLVAALAGSAGLLAAYGALRLTRVRDVEEILGRVFRK